MYALKNYHYCFIKFCISHRPSWMRKGRVYGWTLYVELWRLWAVRNTYIHTHKREKWWKKYKHKQRGKHEKTNVKFNLSRFKWSNSFVYYYIFIEENVLDSRKDTQLSKFNLKQIKASKIVHSYVLTQMFLSLKCCRKRKVKLHVEALQ